MLNSSEHEIFPANKQQITDKLCCCFFVVVVVFCFVCLFFLLSLAECEIFYAHEYENANSSWHFHIYQQRIFHAQLS